MTANISNRTSHSNYDKIMAYLPASDCISWLAVFIPECLGIVILSIVTIIAFLKQRQPQRRSTYLIIHLTLVDLLVGAVSGPLQIANRFSRYCDLWNFHSNHTWSFYMKLALLHLFSFISLVNGFCFIRTCACHRLSFQPSVHLEMVYGVIIVIWLTTTARDSLQIVLREQGISTYYIDYILYLPFYLISVFLICLCYVLIVVKVRCSRHPYHHGAASIRERKLTGTSLIVALVSLLCYLPVITFEAIDIYNGPLFLDISQRLYLHIRNTVLLTFLDNLIVNPIIYAVRLPGFIAGVSQIFCSTFNRAVPVVLPLGNVRQFRPHVA